MIEKIFNHYVIANLDTPTKYLMSQGNGHYCLIDNIVGATRFAKESIANVIQRECSNLYNLDLVVIPIKITYELINETETGENI